MLIYLLKLGVEVNALNRNGYTALDVVKADASNSGAKTFRNELECGDEVDVSVVIGNGFEVMECGINFIYQELGEDIQNSYLSWKEVIGGDLRAYRLSTGEHLLCRATFTRNNEAEQISERANWSTTSWGKHLFEKDSVNFTEIDAMTWFVRYKGYKREKLF
ncbi:uncharacterized protein LOC116024399 [Ipomoea triloba]|uniref:uncharacterized protein LOC116024399 n=1 Tax=Ipomoea triloba TaxID=35885 RepID=UPI00125D2911|nr:uncharacterized protein LOC116024399 [Ipomoea triloba]